MWRDRETQFLIENYQGKTIKEIADLLNKSFKAVSSKVEKLSLKKDPTNIKRKLHINSNWSEDEIDYLVNNWRNVNDKGIAEKLNKTVKSIAAKRSRLSLVKDKTNKKICNCNYCKKKDC